MMQPNSADGSPLVEQKERRPHILCIVDGPDWIFSRHVTALQRYLGDEFEFSVSYRGQDYAEDLYDLIYPLEFNMVSPEQINQPWKYVTGIRSFVAWADWDFLTLVNFLATHFQQVHVISRQLFDLFSPYLANLEYVTQGVDLDFFQPVSPPAAEAGRLRVGWAGNRRTFVKGFVDFIEPLGSIPGVELVYRGYADQLLTLEQMPNFYQSVDAYVCASSFEGNNNSLLEAAAMARAIITTPTGTVSEFLRHNQSALIVERDLEQFKSAVLRLRDNPELRIWLGKNARQALVDGGWGWKAKAEEFRSFFRGALANAHRTPSEMVVIEPPDPRHFASVLQTQFVLARELRIGSARQALDLGLELEAARKEIRAIKDSETYRLVEWGKSTWMLRGIIKIWQRLKASKG